MKKKFFLFPLFATLLLSLGACDDDDNNTELPDYRKTIEAKITGFIAMNQLSKASGTSWDSNDQIGIYMKSAGKTLSASTILNSVNNIAYTTIGSTNFNPVDDKIYFPDLSIVPVDFVAYYPYSSTLVGEDLTYNINVTDQSNQAAINFMYSGNATDKNNDNENVSLVFTSQLSTLRFNFTAIEGLTEADLKGITVKIGDVNTTAKFDLTSAALTSVGDKTSVNAKVAEDGLSAQAILIPASDAAGTVLTFTLTNGVTFDYTLPAGRKFESNKTYIYNVSVGNTTSPIVTASTSIVGGVNVTTITNIKSATYAVGDAYPDASNPIAVVYEVSDGGKSGKAILLKTYTNATWWSQSGANFDPKEDGAKDADNGLNNMNTIKAQQYWDVRYPIFVTVSKLGANWYIPALNELKYLNDNKATINPYIESLGGDLLGNDSWYLSSTEDGSGLVDAGNEPWNAVIVDFGDGSTHRLYKRDAASYCRAICVF